MKLSEFLKTIRLLLLISFSALVSCAEKGPAEIPVSSVTINKTAIQMKVGETETLTVTITPSNATEKEVFWTSSNSNVVDVDTEGLITAKGVGKATITAEVGGVKAKCSVEVTPSYIEVSSVELDKSEVSLRVAETVTLKATVNPDDATDKTVTWSTSDETIAIVSNGVVIAKKIGKTVVIAEAGNKTATCQVTVLATDVTSVTLDKTTASLKAGETVTLTATVNPSDATDKTVTWTTSDQSVATVSDGVVTAKKVGTATITAQAGNKTATCQITVVATEVTSVTLNKTAASLKAGESVTLTATVNPDDATDKTVTWTTSDQTVATISNGVVAAKQVGTATITAKAGDKTATCQITVVATEVTSVTLNRTTASLKAGESVTLTATVNPDDATDKTVTWTTSDQTVATISNGVVAAKQVGTATITAKAGDKTATCQITVVATEVTSVTLNKTSASLKAGESVTLTATVNPSDATDKAVTWTTSDQAVATVSNGVVTAKKVGTATITAKAGDKTATCQITVVAMEVTSVTLNKTTASLKAGESVTLTATVNPSDATDKTVTWTTSDQTVATVSNGVVTAKKVGTATITAKAGDKTATCQITVVATEVTSVTLNRTTASIKAGETVTLTATVNPSDATDKTVTWTTSDQAVATVSNGVVTAKKVGTATITAKAGDKTATCQITVVAMEVTSVTLNKTTASLKAGETVTLTATVNPSDATDKTVTWTTSDQTVATVSNGVVTAKKVGTATITAKAGSKTATCQITVVATEVTSVTLNKTTESLKAGESVTLTATVNPDDATDKTVTWTTSDQTVATVSNGVVTAKKVGTATITAKAGDKTATCQITVVATEVTSVTLDKTTASLKAGETVTLTATVNPSDATDKTVTWTTSDQTVATVSNGVVTAKKVGTATITAKAGSKTATCTITVEPSSVDKHLVFPDINLKKYLIDNYDLNDDGGISEDEAVNIAMVSCRNKNIADLTGLEECKNITTIDCSENYISEIKLPGLTKLVSLVCYGNPIEVLDLSNCSALRVLNILNSVDNAINGNKLQIMNYDLVESLTIDVSNTALDQMSVCRCDLLSYLDLSKNTHLKSLKAYVNPNLKSVDVSKLVELEFLDFGDCGLTDLDVSQNVVLAELYVTNNKLSNINVSQNKQLKVLKCNGNQISNLKILNNDKLETIDASNNLLSSIILSNQAALKSVNVSGNTEISLLDLSNSASIESINAIKTNLSKLIVKNKQTIVVKEEAATNRKTYIEGINIVGRNGLSIFDANGTEIRSFNTPACIISGIEGVKSVNQTKYISLILASGSWAFVEQTWRSKGWTIGYISSVDMRNDYKDVLTSYYNYFSENKYYWTPYEDSSYYNQNGIRGYYTRNYFGSSISESSAKGSTSHYSFGMYTE